MAACGSLRHIFENPITENNSSSSSLIDSLTSWKPIKPLKPPIDHSFTEIFGELHFKEHHPDPTSSSSFFTPPLSSSSSSSLSSLLLLSQNPANVNDCKNDNNEGIVSSMLDHNDGYSKSYHRKSDSFSSLNSDSLQLCTEGLGSESLCDVEDLKIDSIDNSCSNKLGEEKERVHVRRHSSDSYSYCRNIIKANGKQMFPPPVSYIGQSGKSAVSFQSYRKDGRFVLKEVRIPTKECLQASREDGRLRLSFVQSNDDDDDDGDHGHDHDDENGVEDDEEDDENGGEDDGEEEEQELGSIVGIEEVEDEGRVRDDE